MKFRDILITFFVIAWTVVFHYESTRHFYLERWMAQPLPKIKFLFPPAGWIMFFNVDDQFSYAEVYGVNEDGAQLIDPHGILATRTIGFDNIHRNVLSAFLARQLQPEVCRFLKRKFPEFNNFLITAVHYPSVTKMPRNRIQRIFYQCQER